MNCPAVTDEFLKLTQNVSDSKKMKVSSISCMVFMTDVELVGFVSTCII